MTTDRQATRRVEVAEVRGRIAAHPAFAGELAGSPGPAPPRWFRSIAVGPGSLEAAASAGVRVVGGLGDSNEILVEEGLTGCDLQVTFNGRARNLLVVERGLQIRGFVNFESDGGAVAVRGGWLVFSFRLRDPDCAVLVGDRCTLEGVDVWVEGAGRSVVIGGDCLFARDVMIRTGDSHAIFSTDERRILNPPQSVRVGRHAWIGTRAHLLKGAEVGAGAIVGAASIVSAGRPVPPMSLAVGSPARVVKRGVTWSHDRAPAVGEMERVARALARER